jgi:transposase
MTSTWRSRAELAHQVTLLAKQGESRRAIARAVGVSRNTVRTLLAAHAQGRDTEHVALTPRPTRAPRAAKIDAWRSRIAELMAKYADITAQRVFEMLRAEGFDGGYTGVKRHVRAMRPPRKPTPSLTTRLQARRDVRERLVALRDPVHDWQDGRDTGIVVCACLESTEVFRTL